MSLTLQQKSSIAELPLNLAWNIQAFSGSFAAAQDDRAFLEGEIYAQPTKSK
jgi:hypothetical protein